MNSHGSSTLSTGGLQVTLAGITAGNILIGALTWTNSSTGALTGLSVSSALGNTITTVASDNTFPSVVSGRLLYRSPITVGGSETLSFNFAGGGTITYSNFIVAEYSGIDTASIIDAYVFEGQSAPGAGANTIFSSSITTTSDNEIVIGFAFNMTGIVNISSGTSPITWTERENIDQSNGSQVAVLEETVKTSAGSIQATFGTVGGGADDYVVSTLALRNVSSASQRGLIRTYV